MKHVKYDKNRLDENSATMATRPFADISEEEIENLIEKAVPEKTKIATKYGMKIFNGKERHEIFFDIFFSVKYA